MVYVSLAEAEKYLENDRAMCIDTEEHDAKIRADVIDEFTDWLFEQDEIFFPIDAISIMRKELEQLKIIK